MNKLPPRSKQFGRLQLRASDARRKGKVRGRPTPGGGGGGSTFGKAGANLGQSNRFSGQEQFINRIRTAEANWYDPAQAFGTISPFQNAFGWLTSIPAAGRARLYLKLDGQVLNNYQTPGQYKATSSTGLTLQFGGGSGFTSISAAAVGLITCTAVVSGSGNYTSATGYDWYIDIINNTAGALSLSDLAVFHIEDETRHLAGKLYRTRFLSAQKNKSVLRFLDWTQGNLSPSTTVRILTVADLRSESYRFWGDGFCPYGVMAKAMTEAAELYPTDPIASAWMHINLPAATDTCRFGAIAATDRFYLNRFDGNVPNGVLRPHGYLEGTPVVKHGFQGTTYGGLSHQARYYVRNPTTTDFQLSLTPGGAIIDVTADAPADSNSYGHMLDRADRDYQALYNAVMAQIFAVFPGGKVKPEANNEPWNSQFDQSPGWSQAVISWQRYGVGGNLSAHGWLQMMCWKAAENAGYAPANIAYGANFQMDNDGYHTLAVLDAVDPGLFTAGQTLAQVMNAKPNPQGWWAPYHNVANPATGVYYTYAEAIAAGAPTWTDQQWYDSLLAGHTLVAANLAARKTNYLSRVPNGKISTYESGNHLAPFGVSGGGSMTARFQQFFKTAQGLQAFQDYHQRVFLDNGALEQVHYVYSGGHIATDQFASTWGLRPYYEATGWPVADYFDALV
jgi:hypothetical protein